MATYIVKNFYQKDQCIYDIERGLNLLNSLIKAFLKDEDDLDRFSDLILEKLRLERGLFCLLYPIHLDDSNCISPEWDEIGSDSFVKNEQPQNLKTELELIKTNKNTKRTVKKRYSSKINISSVLEKAGLVLKNGFILCPFHSERNPSLKIYFHTDSFYCFGCHKHGKAEDLAKALGVTP